MQPSADERSSMSESFETSGLSMFFILLFVVAVLWLMHSQKKKRDAAIEARLRKNFGQKPVKRMEAERYAKVPSFYLRRRGSVPPSDDLDDITWNDLDMDALYARIDCTVSSAGEEYLYALLRTPAAGENASLSIPLAKIRYFEEDAHEEIRIRLQKALHTFGYTGRYSLYEYLDLLKDAERESNIVHVPAFVLPAASFFLMLYSVQAGILCLVASFILNMLTYYRRRGRIEPYLTTFGHLLRMVQCAQTLTRIDCPALQEENRRLRELSPVFDRFKRGSGIVLSGTTSSGGNPVDFLVDYLRILFHLDLIRFNTMLSHYTGHQKEMEEALVILGRIDTAICLASFEKSLPYTCEPELTVNAAAQKSAEKRPLPQPSCGNSEQKVPGEKLLLTQVYHPLLEHPVPNSLCVTGSILLTGSNASGKSTFLKAAAICAVLAQTAGFCPARKYRGFWYCIRSSMALRDSITAGESYFMAEIRSLKRIEDLRGTNSSPVLCFIDEVLRGTNTIERIAASAELLRLLAADGAICFAATHDIELTQLLSPEFTNYHFEEELKGGDVTFSYVLKDGPAMTRNAIRLLGTMGFDPQMVKNAARRAEIFEETGQWT